MSSVNEIAEVGANFAASMNQIAKEMLLPKNVSDPGKIMKFQQQMMYAQNGYQFAARSIQDLQREDQTLAELLRDA